MTSINGTLYSGEFPTIPHAEYTNLVIKPGIGKLERVIGLLNDLVEGEHGHLFVVGWSHGGFVPIGCSSAYQTVSVTDLPEPDTVLPANLTSSHSPNPFAIYIDPGSSTALLTYAQNSYIVCSSEHASFISHKYKYPLSSTEYVLCVPESRKTDFDSKFRFYFDAEGNFTYDNLIHLCIMVKNGGELFEKVLQENLPWIDRWTILDTGSTDGTQDIVRRVLANKKGTLYEEPFINFRDSRNRCLDLASKNCKYNVMLDDTYVIRGEFRTFLNTIRGDQFADSYSLLILSDDTEYYSNRVTKSAKGLRYVYTIHEVIQGENNVTVVIPKEAAYIHDYRAPYMEARTMSRKHYDLQCLFEMLQEEPTNPRHLYYLAQTYNVLEDYENAAKYFELRANSPHSGFKQEAVDSQFELARLYNFKLGKPWAECEAAYLKAFTMEPERPDALYFIGIHYALDGTANRKAYDYFKQAFALGYPIHTQFSLKPTLANYFLPKFLIPLCYEFADWPTGVQACQRFLSFLGHPSMKNTEERDVITTVKSWYSIFQLLVTMPPLVTPTKSEKPLLAFVADGGWGPWTGSDILTKGVGGSETYIIELARWIQASGSYTCIVFCRCAASEVFEGVIYSPIELYPSYVTKMDIHTCIISRYSEYLPVAIHGHVENIYLVLHDLGPTANIIPLHPKLKKILCLTDWHVGHFLKEFPQCADRTESFYYGIDLDKFNAVTTIPKKKHSFIYSSFPNRGLLQLLQMWPSILAALPDATLHIYSDVNGKWVNEVAPDTMNAIRALYDKRMSGVTVHGWVNKEELARAWAASDIWLYPCTFKETFCLTALEAAASGTLAIAPPLAALEETVGSRGVLVDGDPTSEEWQQRALRDLLAVLANPTRKASLVASNLKWARANSWQSRADTFIQKYLNPTALIYANMYNWTHDLPTGSRARFEEALAIAKPAHILEIGTFAGTSLIEMLRLCPTAKAIAVDRWENYVEDTVSSLSTIEENNIQQIFMKNVSVAGMTGRVTAMKGDSVTMLLDLTRQRTTFDFIYVDGSHKCLDCYTDMAIAWGLLIPGGVMAVDDVMYHADKVAAGELLEYPLKGVEHFLQKYAGEYTILSSGYRVFLRKNLDTDGLRSIKHFHYGYNVDIMKALEQKCSGLTPILEIGPGTRPFELATHRVDNGSTPIHDRMTTITMDIDTDRFVETDGFYKFGYCRHVFEDIQNPDFCVQRINTGCQCRLH